MKQVNMHEAKTNLSRLVDEAVAGEEVVIARAGTPVAKLVPILSPKPERRGGFLKGKWWLAPDWDSPETNKMIEDMFYEALEDDDV
jgi:prevent-host-death family protein